MEIDYENLEKETLKILESNRIWVLSTSCDDLVTSRSMSVVNVGLSVYFQTNKSYTKYQQMMKNPQVALCFSNVSIEGVAKEAGTWNDPENARLLDLYKKYHRSSLDTYGSLDGQVVMQIVPKQIKFWKYVAGQPLREILFVEARKAERLDFID